MSTFETTPGVFVPAPAGIVVVRGKPYNEKRPLRRAQAFVVHETVTRNAAAADRVLRKRRLSVQLVTDEVGQTIQHEPLLIACEHAGRARNPVTIGDEVTNPYYPKHLRKGLVWSDVIEAPWAHGDRYVLPTPAQAEAVATKILWFTLEAPAEVRIPDLWPGVSDGFIALGRVKGQTTRGVLAHAYFGHADGTWLVAYAWLRIKAGLPPEVAYAEAKRRATGVQKMDVRDLVSKEIR